MDLIIVESPSKAKTISKYLKGKYRVDASAGHIRDLPEKSFAVDIKNNFEPTYEIMADKKMTKQELLDVLEEFYTPEKQSQYGVLGIRIEKM